MACPTCSETMQGLHPGCRWCPRCGTLWFDEVCGMGRAVAPKLVARCQELATTVPHDGIPTPGGHTSWPLWWVEWCRLGIAEAINIPEDRT